MALVESASAQAKTTIAPSDSSLIAVKNVLFATDFSSTSEAAFPYAAAICRRFGSTLHAVHVLGDAGLMMMSGGVDFVSVGAVYEDAHASAMAKLEEISNRLEDVPHHNYIGRGKVWDNLAAIIREQHIDLIVLGTHGRTGLGKLLLGSVAENILRHATCPVLTVGPHVSGRAKLPALPAGAHDLAPLDLEIRQMLFATNFTPGSQRVAEEAVALAAEFESRLTLLHVVEDYSEIGTRPQAVIEIDVKLRALIAANAPLPFAPLTATEFGDPAEQILKVALDQSVDLIVLGVRTAQEVGTTHMPWSTAHDVIAHAQCPVLTLRV